MRLYSRDGQAGFTLAELLVALLILGTIAIFAIPKVLNAQQSSQKYAIFKETISTVHGVMYQGWMQNAIDNTTDMRQYYMDHMNYVKGCYSEGIANNCIDSGYSPDDLNAWVDNPWRASFKLHNGALVWGLVNASCGLDWCLEVIIDWNGETGPNVFGDDLMVLKGRYDHHPGGSGGCQPRAGELNVEYGATKGPESCALYAEVFSK